MERTLQDMTLKLDYSNMLSSRLTADRGIDPSRLDGLAERFAAVHAEVEARRKLGELGFFELPYADQEVDMIERFAEDIGSAQFSNVVVLGIGGSALGTIAMRTALLDPFWNELDDEGREYFPRLYIVDNPDPATFAALLRRLDLRRTLFNVISKSGGTAETMSQFLVVRERLEAALGDSYRRHVVFTTDPKKGVLRALAESEGLVTFSVPANVGGRFSVLSAVGLLPAAMVGIPIRELLAGARSMDERCRSSELAENPAGIFAALQYLAHVEKGAPIHVMMPYSDRLRHVADWFKQLWAESLGKRYNLSGEEIFAGPTPVSALGTTDQHSQVQLFMEGPFDKTVTFLIEEERGEDLPIPSLYEDRDELAYLGGHSFGELMRVEKEATAAALALRGRMNMTIELPRIDARSLGELFFFLQVATVYAGALYNVNPLDQPGVELGKELTYGILGRPGFEAQRAEWEAAKKKGGKKVV